MANYLCANGVCIIEIKIKFKKNANNIISDRTIAETYIYN